MSIRDHLRRRLLGAVETGTDLVLRRRPPPPAVTPRRHPWGHILIVGPHHLEVEKTPVRGLEALEMDAEGWVTLQMRPLDMRDGRLLARMEPDNVLKIKLLWNPEDGLANRPVFEVDLDLTDRPHHFEFRVGGACTYTLYWYIRALYGLHIGKSGEIDFETQFRNGRFDPTINPDPDAPCRPAGDPICIELVDAHTPPAQGALSRFDGRVLLELPSPDDDS